MFLFTLKRGSALAVSTVLLGGMAAYANPTAPRNAARPVPQGVRTDATKTYGTEQVLIEGGTLAANYDGNLADLVGLPIACTSAPTQGRDCAAESGTFAKATSTLQYIYAAVGTGGAQLDFVSQKSGAAAKTASTVPEFADALDAYVGSTGYTAYAGTASEPGGAAEDTIHAAAGDAPIPLGPPEGTQFVPTGFSVYTDSLASYNGGGDKTGAGFNANRGPAKVVPVIGTGISIIVNTSNLTVPSGTPPSGGLLFQQDDVCAIFTGTTTDYSNLNENYTSSNPMTTQNPITIVHRSDGSGSTFLTAYDLSQMCGPNNPSINQYNGIPIPAHYWNQTGFTQGVGTDSRILATTFPTDKGAPEVVWPSTSVGVQKTSGVINAIAYGIELNGNGVPVQDPSVTYPANIACTAAGAPTAGDTCSNPAGYVGYVSPSNALGPNTTEAYVENYHGNYEQANATTVAASLSGTSSGDANPPGYPIDNKSTTLYFPFPTATNGDALVGYSYGYFYTCYPTRLKDQATGIKDLFGYESASKTAGLAATAAAFWNLNALSTAQLKELTSALSFKTAAVPASKPQKYISPVDGSTKEYSCTDN